MPGDDGKGSARRVWRRAMLVALAVVAAIAAGEPVAARGKIDKAVAKPPAASGDDRPRHLFGWSETAHPPALKFTKWTATLARYEEERELERAPCAEGDCALPQWRAFLDGLKRASPMAQLRAVNAYLNRVPYRTDIDNYGVEDYWATPRELFARGGDCEDYAIAKYLSLRALGWPAERLRVAVITDRARDLVHSVLIAYHDGQAFILDIEIAQVTEQRRIDRYAPIFAIGETGWWSYRQAEAQDAAERAAPSRLAPQRAAPHRAARAKPELTAKAPPKAGRVKGKAATAVVAMPRAGEKRSAQPRREPAKAPAPLAAPNEMQAAESGATATLAPGERVEDVFLPAAR